MSKISILSVFLWVIAAVLVAVTFEVIDEGFDFVVAGFGTAVLIAFWAYAIQRRKLGRPKKIANLSISLWILALITLLFSFDGEGDLVDIAIGSGFFAGIAIMGCKWQLRYMRRAGIETEKKQQTLVLEKSGDATADGIIAEGNAHIKKLEELGHIIQDVNIRRQITHLQSLGKQIFEHIAKNPEQVRKLNTFMDYYFPTTIKFLENYADMDRATVKGEHIRASMEEISKSMSCIEKAFEHQLDNLYSDQVLDISADVAVLQGIMRNEGISKIGK